MNHLGDGLTRAKILLRIRDAQRVLGIHFFVSTVELAVLIKADAIRQRLKVIGFRSDPRFDYGGSEYITHDNLYVYGLDDRYDLANQDVLSATLMVMDAEKRLASPSTSCPSCGSMGGDTFVCSNPYCTLKHESL